MDRPARMDCGERWSVLQERGGRRWRGKRREARAEEGWESDGEVSLALAQEGAKRRRAPSQQSDRPGRD